jgi:hypothetical protein
LGIRKAAERSYGGPGAVKIDRSNGILNGTMAEQNSKDIKYVMTVIGKSKRMDGGVEMDHDEHQNNT